MSAAMEKLLSGNGRRRRGVVPVYADEWIVSITDVTPLARMSHAHVRDGELDVARRLLPRERPCPVSGEALAHLHR
ncbi:DUF4291 family protein [Streptomyces sp. TRM S81-3]|uniref:DUF4291 family protein n=1 Tax=Streptomyces griseicoloratus TaxID=2752516 RepID=A0A926QR48_9ACTN|nr:DUF4291 family protein [Streptomyces griseicoloratus]